VTAAPTLKYNEVARPLLTGSTSAGDRIKNLNRNPTKDELRALLASRDDTAGHHVLWVAADGEVHITTLPRVWPPGEFTPPSNLRLRYETFLAGNGYVGQEAAEDDDWVDKQFARLLEEWERVKGTTVREFIHID
jgi:hypothetical protein